MDNNIADEIGWTLGKNEIKRVCARELIQRNSEVGESDEGNMMGGLSEERPTGQRSGK